MFHAKIGCPKMSDQLKIMSKIGVLHMEISVTKVSYPLTGETEIPPCSICKIPIFPYFLKLKLSLRGFAPNNFKK